MKGAGKFYVAIGLALALLVASELAAPRAVDWTESYTGTDRIPFGAFIVREQLDSLLVSTIVDADRTLTETLPDNDDYIATNYVIINDSFDPDELDIERLLEYVEGGNTAFIAAKYFGAAFGDSLGFENYTNALTGVAGMRGDVARFNWTDTLRLEFTSPSLRVRAGDSVRVGMSYGYFEAFDTTTAKVLATDAQGRAVFISVPRGDGTLLLHSIPVAFTNLNVLHPRTARHAFGALSYLPDEFTYWDEYYKSGRKVNPSPLREITGDDSLAMAWYLLLIGGALFLLVQSRRRQRPIPIVTPPANTTVEFVEMIGRLYFERGAHTTIADRKISYFLEYVRSRLGVRTDRRGEQLVQRVAERSGVAATRVRALFARISVIEHRGEVDDDDLLALERDLNEFYSNSQR